MSGSKEKRWRTSASEIVTETPVFSLRKDRKHRAGDRDGTHDFFILESVDWANIIPVTEDDEVVFIELYRHGTEEVSLEIPGGMVDPEDETPLAAAAREMREETGYVSDSIISLGVVHPNPAIQANRCFSFLAKGARLAGAPRLDETEDITVVRYPRSEVPGLLRAGKIGHALVVCGFLWYFQHEGLLGDGP